MRAVGQPSERSVHKGTTGRSIELRKHSFVAADLAQVGAWLQGVLCGWSQYYAVPGNYVRLRQFRDALQRMGLRALRRRSQRGRRLIWAKFSKLSRRWLPTPKILHPYPNGQHPR